MKREPKTTTCRICLEQVPVGEEHTCDKNKTGVVEALRVWVSRNG